MLRGPFGLGGRNNWPGNGLLKEAEEQMLKWALSRWKGPSVCCLESPRGREEKCYLLVSAGPSLLAAIRRDKKRGLTLLPARRRGKERGRVWLALPFMVPGEVCSGRIASVILVVSPPLLRSVNGAVTTTSTEILVLTSTSAKECYPRIHRLSLFSLSFSLLFLSLSLSLCPISGDSSSCRKRPKSRRRGSQLLKKLQILNTRVDRRTFF